LPRPLPSSLVGSALVSAGFALLVLVMPGTLLVWGIRQRHAPSAAGALVWFTLAVAGASLSVIVQYGDEAQWSVLMMGWWRFAGKLTMNVLTASLAGLPLIAFAAAVVLCLWRRQWGRLGLLLLASAALAGLTSWVVLTWLALPLELGQQYSWKGWYSIWPAGPYLAGCFLILGVLLVVLLRLGQSVMRRIFKVR
jgi:hypothetical protein